MKTIPKATYETADQIDARIAQRLVQAQALPQGNARQSILIEIARLRAYADIKRWLNRPVKENRCRI